MIPLTDKENKSYEKQNVCYICKREFSTNKEIIATIQKNIEELLAVFSIQDTKHRKKFQ